MGCGCNKAKPAAATGQGATRTVSASGGPDPAGAVIAAARAGGPWRLKTATGSTYDFPTLAEARTAWRVHGGSVDRK